MPKAVSVNGLVEPGDLGRTLPHEHLFASMSYAFPPQDEEALQPITIERLGAIRLDLMTNIETITLDETCDQEGELVKARESGIRTLVELTLEVSSGAVRRLRRRRLRVPRRAPLLLQRCLFWHASRRCEMICSVFVICRDTLSAESGQVSRRARHLARTRGHGDPDVSSRRGSQPSVWWANASARNGRIAVRTGR